MIISIPEIDALLKSYTDRLNGLVGVAAIAVDKNGNTIYAGASGNTSVDPAKATPTTLDTIHWLASQTKLVAAIAAMQCVERGQIDLDDPVGTIVPELAELDVLEGFEDDGKPRLRKARTGITLRMLLAHTSGFAYAVRNPDLKKWEAHVGKAPAPGKIQDYIQPLAFEPGTSWAYGPGIDWAGQVIERLNKCTLEEFMENNIFMPLNMTSTTFHPEHRPEFNSRMADLTIRQADGTLQSSPQPYPNPAMHDLGGSGLYSTPNDYGKLLSALMQDGGKILKPESVEEIFKPQVNEEIGVMNRVLWWSRHPELEVNFGLTASINIGTLEGMRGAGSGTWGGSTCKYWWVDRETGVAATIFEHMFPPNDEMTYEFFDEFERALYKHVRA